MSKLQAWIKQKGRPFQVKAQNGRGTVAIQFHDGYVAVVGIQPGLRRHRLEIRITRSAWLQLLGQVAGPTRLMGGPDFDAHRAEREYLQQEREHVEALRHEKRQRRQDEIADAKRQRYLRAQKRARRKRRAGATE